RNTNDRLSMISVGYLHIIVAECEDAMKLEVDYNDSDSITSLLKTLKRSFRRIIFDLLLIESDENPVNETLLDCLTSQFDFKIIDI
ncbi:hypothetical protein PFISCL1PPCAC_25071, partial [Pristionchus fissidentatus]